MSSRLSRRSLLALAGGSSLAGCLNTSPTDGDDNGDETDSGGSGDASDPQNGRTDGSIGLDAYDFAVDVPEERHEEALENLLEGIKMVNDSEEGDELYISGEIVSYTDDGTDAEMVVEYPEGYTDSDGANLNETAYAAGEFFGEQIVISVLLGKYAYNASSLPETFEVRYSEDGADEPFETSTMTAEEAANFYEENGDGETIE